MSQYNVFQAIFMSFYSGNLYRDVGQNWGGKVFLYLLVLLSLLWIVPTIGAQAGLTLVYSKLSAEVVAEIPVITIKQGKISTPENRPYLLVDPTEKKTKDKVFAIIDTTGKYTSLENTGASLLVTETQVILKHSETETRTYQIPATTNATYNPVTINEAIKHYIGYAWILIYLFLLFFSYLYQILKAMIYSLIGKLVSVISSSGVNYGTILTITMVAITPAILLATALELFDITFPHQILTYFIISMFYMIFGIRANKI